MRWEPKNKKWHRWFAWYPVTTIHGWMVWWEYVDRRDWGKYILLYEYRFPIPDDDIEILIKEIADGKKTERTK